MKAAPIRIAFRRLGRERAYGLAWVDDRKIEVDVCAHPDELSLLDTIIHEVIHCADGELEEERVSRIAAEVAPTLWGLGYRRTHGHEPKNDSDQSEKKESNPAPAD